MSEWVLDSASQVPQGYFRTGQNLQMCPTLTAPPALRQWRGNACQALRCPRPCIAVPLYLLSCLARLPCKSASLCVCPLFTPAHAVVHDLSDVKESMTTYQGCKRMDELQMHALADAEVHGGGGNDGEGWRLASCACCIQCFLAEGMQQIPPRMPARLCANNGASGQHIHSGRHTAAVSTVLLPIQMHR
jgi:hypothetical protein